MVPLVLAAALAAPVAIVDAADGVAGVRPLDLVEAGTVIELGDDGRVRLAYFASCVLETVRGGRVVVGVLGSLVRGGEVSRVVAECDAPDAPADGAPGALVLRGADRRR